MSLVGSSTQLRDAGRGQRDRFLKRWWIFLSWLYLRSTFQEGDGDEGCRFGWMSVDHELDGGMGAFVGRGICEARARRR